MKSFEVLMLQGLSNRDPLFRIENEQFFQQIHCQWISIFEHFIQIFSFSFLGLLHEFSPLVILNFLNFFFGGCTDEVENQFQLTLS